MAPVKRSRVAAAAAPEAKKAKVVDPITAKIDLIASIISDSACEVPASQSHRDMLLLSIPHTLSVPSDERHPYQTQVADMVGDVLKQHVAAWEKTVESFQANIGLSSQKEAETMKLVEESASKIDVQETEVTKCKEQLSDVSQAATSAEETLQFASKEVEEFDEKLKETISQKEECTSVFETCFVPMKDGATEAGAAKGLLKQLEPMLKKLCIEGSLLSALAPALKKTPADRGSFDVMAVDGAESVFTKHLAEMKEQIDTADVVKAGKVGAESTAKGVFNAAMETRTSSEATLKSAEDELLALETAHQELYKSANVASLAAAGSHAELATKEQSLDHVKKVMEAFTELLERQTAVPEPEAADVLMEAKLDAINEDSVMEPVAVA